MPMDDRGQDDKVIAAAESLDDRDMEAAEALIDMSGQSTPTTTTIVMKRTINHPRDKDDNDGQPHQTVERRNAWATVRTIAITINL
ncbi:hypothetical protein TWF281_009777 [Arthrobotrys megalospora]